MDKGRDWRSRRKCVSMTPAQADKILFGSMRQFKLAVNYCADCPVRALCINEAIETNDEFSFVGGTTYKQRQRIAIDQYLVRVADHQAQIRSKYPAPTPGKLQQVGSELDDLIASLPI